jgi:hypothetical protein
VWHHLPATHIQIYSNSSKHNCNKGTTVIRAIAKILHYNAAAVPNTHQVIVQWIDTLPVVKDEEAAPYAYAYLSELIDQ